MDAVIFGSRNSLPCGKTLPVMGGVKTFITLLCDLFAFFWFALRQQAALPP
jgi:hypothetical protein